MRSAGGKTSRRLLATLIILLTFTPEFHPAILAFASTGNLVSTPIMAEEARGAVEFLREQLEKVVSPDDSVIERRYIVPRGMNLSDADRIWMSIASLISLGYGEGELIEALSRLGPPKKLEANNVTTLIDYSGLRIVHNMEDGEVSVEIPITCNGSLSSTYYNITGVKRLIKLFNVTFIRRYEISANASELFNVTYRDPSTGGLTRAMVNLSSDLKLIESIRISLTSKAQPPRRSISSFPTGWCSAFSPLNTRPVGSGLEAKKLTAIGSGSRVRSGHRIG